MKEKEELSNEEIVKFYHNVLLRYERDIKDPEEQDEDKRKLNPVSLLKIEESRGIEHKYDIKIIPSYNPLGENEPYESDTIKIYFDPKGKREQPKIHPHTYYFIYFHLRDSFAHGYINKEGDYYLLHDRNSKGELTMIAKIKQNALFNFIDEIYNTSKKYKEQNNN